MLAEGLATAEAIGQARSEVEAQVEEAIRFAEESPLPSPEELLDNVYTEAGR